MPAAQHTHISIRSNVTYMWHMQLVHTIWCARMSETTSTHTCTLCAEDRRGQGPYRTVPVNQAAQGD
jgi:hypothetical protein